MGGSLSHFRCLACWVVEFNYKCPFNTGWQQQKWPFQVLFRCPRSLNRGVRLTKVLFKVNKGNKFGDFGYCPLNAGFTVSAFLLTSAWSSIGKKYRNNRTQLSIFFVDKKFVLCKINMALNRLLKNVM